MNIINRKPIVVGIGELLWDLLPLGKKAGGAPINFVYHAIQAGAQGFAISTVGNDQLGEELLKELETNNLNGLIQKVQYPTGTVRVELNEKGIPTYDIVNNVAWDHIKPTSKAFELAEQADAICFGTLAQRCCESRDTIQSILSYAHDSTLKFFDLNLRQNFFNKEIIEESFYLANVAKCNDDEIEILKELFAVSYHNTNDVVTWFMEHYNLKMFVLTAGSSHSTIYTNEGIVSTIKTPIVKAIDTVGSGDAFSGVLIASLLKGESIQVAHQKAVKTAAFVCTQLGARPSYKNL